MTRAEFQSAPDASALAPPLAALWHDARGDWKRAHECVQEGTDRESAWVHAYLHRKEGDEGNAGYWYRRAGRKMPQTGLDEEAAAIADELLRSL